MSAFDDFATEVMDAYINGNHSEALEDLKSVTKIEAAAVVARIMVRWFENGQKSEACRFAAWLEREQG